MDHVLAAKGLRAGAGWVRDHGWAQDTAQKPTGEVCSLGGLARGLGLPIEVCYDPRLPSPGYDEATEALAWYLAEHGKPSRIPTWNWRAESGDEVAETMEKAAAWIEEKI